MTGVHKYTCHNCGLEFEYDHSGAEGYSTHFCGAYCHGLDTGAKLEREACARIAEKAYRNEPDGIDDGFCLDVAKSNRSHRIAKAIRDRSKQ